MSCTKYRLKVSLDMSYCRDWEQNNCVPAIIFFQLHNVIKFVNKPVVDWHAETRQCIELPTRRSLI